MADDEQIKQSTESVEQKVDASKLNPEQKEQAKRGYTEYVKEKGHDLYESWIPWIEDQYLSWFTNDNKASYATKQQLDKTKVTNIESVNILQDDVNSMVSNQFGKGGLFQPVGDAVSKEGINRAEQGGGDSTKTGSGYLASASSYVSEAGSSAYSGAKGAAGYVGGMIGGNKETDKADTGKTEEEQTKPSQPTQQTKSMVDQTEDKSTQAVSEAQSSSKPDTSTAQQATKPVTDAASKGAGALQDGAKAGGSYAASAGDTVSGLLGGKKA